MSRLQSVLKPILLVSCLLSSQCSSPTAPVLQNIGVNRSHLLQSVKTWMYQINDLDVAGAIEALAASDYELLVLEPTANIIDQENFDTPSMLKRLRLRPNGQRRILLAYIDIGEAENYRTYWKKTWTAPTGSEHGAPDFLLTVDPDGWSGNYPVAYWDGRWQSLWLGENGLVARWVKAGFDGVYLDWVGAYEEDAVQELADLEQLDAAERMLDFIRKIRNAGEKLQPNFLVVAQNAPYLINENPAFYVQIVDALAVEDTWFAGEGDAEWDDPNGGDLPNPETDEWSTANRLQQYQVYQAHGLPVFSVDYCLNPVNVAQVYTAARQAGLIPLVTRVALSRVSETPPPF
ncbi:endo alpha-1,4 polygalactosaminidase [candidate division KSB1 bacterium]|nr:endo alpha-1,4 polygalactosaminidase [candidate division KSB1 bacterium]